MRRDRQNELLVALVIAVAMAFALVFSILLSLGTETNESPETPILINAETLVGEIPSSPSPELEARLTSSTTASPSQTPPSPDMNAIPFTLPPSPSASPTASLTAPADTDTPRPSASHTPTKLTSTSVFPSPSSTAARPSPTNTLLSPTPSPSSTPLATKIAPHTPSPTPTKTPTRAESSPRLTLPPPSIASLTLPPPSATTVALVPFSTATPSLPLCQPRADWEIYIIQAGETLFSIARRYNLTVAQLAAANCLENTRLIYAGDSLRVPRGGPLNLNTSAYQACDSPLAQISFPPPEAEIDGAVTLQGFAFGEGFRRYVLEWRPDAESTYRVFEEVYLAITQEGALGTLETNPLPAGLAWLRLRVFDSADRLLGECAVRVRFR